MEKCTSGNGKLSENTDDKYKQQKIDVKLFEQNIPNGEIMETVPIQPRFTEAPFMELRGGVEYGATVIVVIITITIITMEDDNG